MPENRFGRECEHCRSKFRRAEEIYLATKLPGVETKHRAKIFLLCGECAHTHVKDYRFYSYMIYVGGIQK